MQVEVRESDIDGAGRGLFALQDFKPGDAVLSLDRPYVAELYVDRLQDTCAWCLRRGATDPVEQSLSATEDLPTSLVGTKACNGCHRMRYCSKSCHIKAWKREHKHECKVLAPESRPDLPPGVRAVVKLLSRLEADSKGKDVKLLDILKFRPYTDSASIMRFSENDPEEHEAYETMAYAAWKYAGEPVLAGMHSLSIAKCLYYNVVFNSIALSAPYNDHQLGIGFDPVLCSANHSCDPNTAVIFNQPRLILRALRPIEKGEEITMRYVDTTNPLSIRQDELRRKYYFDCQCTRCRKGPTTPLETFLKPPEKLASSFTSTADGLIERHSNGLAMHIIPSEDHTAMRRLAAIQAEAFSVSGISQDQGTLNKQASEPEIKDALRLCLNSGMWSYKRQPVPHLLMQLFKYYIETRQRYPAWRVGLKMYFEGTVGPDQVLFHPQRVIHIYTLAFLTNALCRPDMMHIRQECMHAGLDLMTVFMGLTLEARDNMPRAHGLDSPFGKIVHSMYEEGMRAYPHSEQQLREEVKETWTKLEVVAKSVDIPNL